MFMGKEKWSSSHIALQCSLLILRLLTFMSPCLVYIYYCLKARSPCHRVHFTSCASHSRGPSPQTCFQVYSVGPLIASWRFATLSTECQVDHFDSSSKPVGHLAGPCGQPRASFEGHCPLATPRPCTSLTRKNLALAYHESWDSPCSFILRALIAELLLRHIGYPECISFVHRKLRLDYIFFYLWQVEMNRLVTFTAVKEY